MPVTTRAKARSLKPLDNLLESSSASTEIRHIGGRDLAKIIKGKGNGDISYDSTCIIDCRCENEYEGGHIRGAVNESTRGGIQRLLFSEQPPNHRKLIVLYCEYSEVRAPRMAHIIRGEDRRHNGESYPRLTFPHIRILTGGYRSFYNGFRQHCKGDYVTEKQSHLEAARARISTPRPKLCLKPKISVLERLREAQTTQV